MISHRTILRMLACAVLIGLIAGCAQTPRTERKTEPVPTATQLQLEQAAKLEAAGDLAAAAAIYENLAAAADPGVRESFSLRAADALLRGGNVDGAADLMAQLQRYRLEPQEVFLARLLDAEILLARSLALEALSVLSAPPDSSVDDALRIRYRSDRAEAYRLNGDLIGSARELAELDLLPDDRALRLDNQLRLVRTLAVLPDSSLQRARADADTLFTGWLELALILKNYDDDADPAAPGLLFWREAYPNHPALPELFGHYLDAARRQWTTFERIAVLLPASGRFAAAAGALRDGLMAAYYAEPIGRRPIIALYDTSNVADVWPLLQQAVTEGAQAVIGPLQKEAVSQLVQAQELPVPVLALNRINLDSPPPPNLYQFGLAPEDEARQAAERAWQDGATSALALVPAGPWGDRLLASFRDRWETLGGHFAESQTYPPESSDFTDPIRKLLNLDESAERHQALVRTLGQSLEYEPRRRRDTGALFVAANTANARSLWPQLQFHRAGDLPVYTTSHIHSGGFSPTADLDLAGLTFPDSPWLLTGYSGLSDTDEIPAALAPSNGALARLFAMGMDSYRLLSGLAHLREFPAATLPGATGELSLDPLNQIHRQLIWARMTAEGPQVLDAADASGMPGAANLPPTPALPAASDDAPR